jgi:hypothetical protein
MTYVTHSDVGNRDRLRVTTILSSEKGPARSAGLQVGETVPAVKWDRLAVT